MKGMALGCIGKESLDQIRLWMAHPVFVLRRCLCLGYPWLCSGGTICFGFFFAIFRDLPLKRVRLALPHQTVFVLSKPKVRFLLTLVPDQARHHDVSVSGSDGYLLPKLILLRTVNSLCGSQC